MKTDERGIYMLNRVRCMISMQRSPRHRLHGVGYTEARIQNMIWDDVAIRAQVTKANPTEIWKPLHEETICPLQLSRSRANSTTIPADAHEAASDNVAVTCRGRNFFG